MQNILGQILKVNDRHTRHPRDSGWNERGREYKRRFGSMQIAHVFQKSELTPENARSLL
jgi:hypothetical protein